MSDFNPVSLFHIIWQVLSGWFWPLVIAALVLIYGVTSGFKGLRRRGLRAGPPLFWALVAGNGDCHVVIALFNARRFVDVPFVHRLPGGCFTGAGCGPGCFCFGFFHCRP